MNILHILYNPYNPDTLIITGENCGSDFSRSIQDTDAPYPAHHPVASDIETLRKIICRYAYNTACSDTILTLEFPRTANSIICSPEWELYSHDVQEKPDSLGLFSVPAIICPVSVLLHLIGQAGSQPEVILGGSCRFWMGVARLTQEMVGRGRYLPSTGRYRNGGICVLWKPVPSSYDQWRINQLVWSMPGLQQRMLVNGSEKKEFFGREASIIQFISTLINQIVSLADQDDPVDYAHAFSPMERLRYVQELTALYFLQGIERHKMPISSPQITNGWRDLFHTWADISIENMPDEPIYSICCRLDETSHGKDYELHDNVSQDPWQITFQIRSTDDPILLIPVETCLAGKNLPPVALPDPPEIKSAIREISTTLLKTALCLTCVDENRFPPVITVDEKDLIRFLTFDVPEIMKTGIEMILPDWWGSPVQKTQVRLLVRKQEESAPVPLVGLHSLLNFDYRIAVGDDIIDPAAFRQMVQQKTPMVRAGKRWVTIDHDQISRILIGTGRSGRKKTITIADFLRLLIRTENGEEDLAIFADDEWTSNLISFIRNGWKQEKEKTPVTFVGNLRPYQETGLSFLLTCRSIGFGACLADDMGLGKTPQTIAYILACKERGLLCGPVLLICPTSIIGNWERELARFSPELSIYIHHGSGRKKGPEFMETASGYNLVITSYALVPRDLEHLSRITWAAMILDEVQNIKNSQTHQYKAVTNLSSVHRIALTGTPVENHLTELWAIMDILNPDYLGTRTSFQKIFVNPIEKGQSDEKAAELRRMIRPFMLRRMKTDPAVINDLPEKLEMQVYCPLTHEQAALYQATLNDLAQDLKTLTAMTRRGRVLAALTRLKQICNHPALITKSNQIGSERSGKIKRLIEMLEEVREGGDAAVIFTQYATFAHMLGDQIHAELGGEVLIMTGSTPRLKRDELITRFMRSDGPGFFVVSLRAGGTGLNLMRATHVFHIDRWWNPAVEDQATDRTYRIGQTRTVQVHMMITSGTLEEQIDEMIKRKRAVAGQVITAGEEWLTELPTGELMDILRLRTRIFGDEL